MFDVSYCSIGVAAVRGVLAIGGGLRPLVPSDCPRCGTDVVLAFWGFNESFKKPFDVALLGERIRTVVEEKRANL